MPQLKCLAACGPAEEPFEAGRVYPMDEEKAALVMRGSPDSWEVVEGDVRLGGPDDYVDYATPAVAVDEAPSPSPEPPLGDAAGPSATDEGDEMSEFDAMNVTQLMVYAREHGISLPKSARTKTAIVDAIEADEEAD